jgi:hypothetical protein
MNILEALAIVVTIFGVIVCAALTANWLLGDNREF